MYSTDEKRSESKSYLVYMTAGANKLLYIYSGRVKEHLASLGDVTLPLPHSFNLTGTCAAVFCYAIFLILLCLQIFEIIFNAVIGAINISFVFWYTTLVIQHRMRSTAVNFFLGVTPIS